MSSHEMYRLRARIAAGARHHPDRPELIAPAQRELKLLHAERLLRTLAGDLDATQRARLVAILSGGAA